MQRRLRDDQDGFTLAEMLVALGIIAGTVLALLGGFITSAASVQAQQERARATRVALDLHEKLRLLSYDELSDPTVVPATQTISATGGLLVQISTVVQDREVTADTTVAGRTVKELVTTARWTGRGGRTGSVVYHTALAQDAGDVDRESGYVKAIKSMTISPDPSASVNYHGHTATPIVVTLVMTGHDVTDTVSIGWSDDSGSGRTVTATSAEGRNWTATIPAGAAGIKLLLDTGERHDLEFRATTTAGLTALSSLAVWGPVLNPPLIESMSVSPNPIKLFKNGQSGHQNTTDVVVSCVVDRLDVSAGSADSVKLKYHTESGALAEQPLTRTAVSGSKATYSFTFVRSQHYFLQGTDLPWTCAVARASDGGPAGKVTNVTVSR